ncbi:unnamed protein product [Ectocarpus sp. CCAP 1310/34]|nr:unnamed protein product [Ectocarpus sp. CCAP 1310/34]CAB1114876.1 unnamed protein product [Ectocarpus sp. CCAP 1310/34]
MSPACSGAAAPSGAAVVSPSITPLDLLRPYTLSLLSFPVGSSLSPSSHLGFSV